MTVNTGQWIWIIVDATGHIPIVAATAADAIAEFEKHYYVPGLAWKIVDGDHADPYELEHPMKWRLSKYEVVKADAPHTKAVVDQFTDLEVVA